MNNSSQYVCISNFGEGAADDPMNNPLTYCVGSMLDIDFNHTLGDLYGQNSKPCQEFMSDYCANEWNGVCEFASQNTRTRFPNQIGTAPCNILTSGEILVRNTASKKYLIAMSANCQKQYRPFDPTVASSPLISYWVPDDTSDGQCVAIYDVNPSTIDTDPVMNRVLQKPEIAMDILLNIYNTCNRNHTLGRLHNTKLARFFNSKSFRGHLNTSQFASW
jgi:hypothetical protein